jgi:excisionase family DNA binding protein
MTMSARVELALPDELIEAIAERVVALVVEQLRAGVAAEPDRLCTLEEAADYFGRSTRWVRDRVRDGSLPWVRLDGGPLRFLRDDLEAFARARRIA